MSFILGNKSVYHLYHFPPLEHNYPQPVLTHHFILYSPSHPQFLHCKLESIIQDFSRSNKNWVCPTNLLKKMSFLSFILYVK